MIRFSIKKLDKTKHFIRYRPHWLLNSGYNVISYDEKGNVYILGYLTFSQILKLKLKLIKAYYSEEIFSIEEIKKEV